MPGSIGEPVWGEKHSGHFSSQSGNDISSPRGLQKMANEKSRHPKGTKVDKWRSFSGT
jgi:hypothetical protein